MNGYVATLDRLGTEISPRHFLGVLISYGSSRFEQKSLLFSFSFLRGSLEASQSVHLSACCAKGCPTDITESTAFTTAARTAPLSFSLSPRFLNPVTRADFYPLYFE